MKNVKKIIFFDGHCGLCDRFVTKIFHLDKKRRFHFAPLQGPTASRMLLTHLTLFDAAPLQIGERPSPNAEDATVPTQTNVDRVSEEDSKFSRELTEQRPHETERTSPSSPGIRGSGMLPPLIDINETAVDELMADITTMNLLLQI